LSPPSSPPFLPPSPVTEQYLVLQLIGIVAVMLAIGILIAVILRMRRLSRHLRMTQASRDRASLDLQLLSHQMSTMSVQGELSAAAQMQGASL
jgi:hypothetical protein